MRKQWVAMLSMLGLAGPAVQSQVLKGSTNESQGNQTATKNKVQKSQIVSPRDPQSGKLKVNQQNLRQQGGANTGQKLNQNNTGTCGALTKANNNQLTPPPPGANNQITKGNNQITKGNNQITKGNNQITKGNNQITKGNNQLTKGANNQLTKANNNQINNNAVQK